MKARNSSKEGQAIKLEDQYSNEFNQNKMNDLEGDFEESKSEENNQEQQQRHSNHENGINTRQKNKNINQDLEVESIHKNNSAHYVQQQGSQSSAITMQQIDKFLAQTVNQSDHLKQLESCLMNDNESALIGSVSDAELRKQLLLRFDTDDNTATTFLNPNELSYSSLSQIHPSLSQFFPDNREELLTSSGGIIFSGLKASSSTLGQKHFEDGGVPYEKTSKYFQKFMRGENLNESSVMNSASATFDQNTMMGMMSSARGHSREMRSLHTKSSRGFPKNTSEDVENPIIAESVRSSSNNHKILLQNKVLLEGYTKLQKQVEILTQQIENKNQNKTQFQSADTDDCENTNRENIRVLLKELSIQREGEINQMKAAMMQLAKEKGEASERIQSLMSDNDQLQKNLRDKEAILRQKNAQIASLQLDYDALKEKLQKQQQLSHEQQTNYLLSPHARSYLEPSATATPPGVAYIQTQKKPSFHSEKPPQRTSKDIPYLPSPKNSKSIADITAKSMNQPQKDQHSAAISTSAATSPNNFYTMTSPGNAYYSKNTGNKSLQTGNNSQTINIDKINSEIKQLKNSLLSTDRLLMTTKTRNQALFEQVNEAGQINQNIQGKRTIQQRDDDYEHSSLNQHLARQNLFENSSQFRSQILQMEKDTQIQQKSKGLPNQQLAVNETSQSEIPCVSHIYTPRDLSQNFPTPAPSMGRIRQGNSNNQGNNPQQGYINGNLENLSQQHNNSNIQMNSSSNSQVVNYINNNGNIVSQQNDGFLGEEQLMMEQNGTRVQMGVSVEADRNIQIEDQRRNSHQNHDNIITKYNSNNNNYHQQQLAHQNGYYSTNQNVSSTSNNNLFSSSGNRILGENQQHSIDDIPHNNDLSRISYIGNDRSHLMNQRTEYPINHQQNSLSHNQHNPAPQLQQQHYIIEKDRYPRDNDNNALSAQRSIQNNLNLFAQQQEHSTQLYQSNQQQSYQQQQQLSSDIPQQQNHRLYQQPSAQYLSQTPTVDRNPDSCNTSHLISQYRILQQNQQHQQQQHQQNPLHDSDCYSQFSYLQPSQSQQQSQQYLLSPQRQTQQLSIQQQFQQNKPMSQQQSQSIFSENAYNPGYSTQQQHGYPQYKQQQQSQNIQISSQNKDLSPMTSPSKNNSMSMKRSQGISANMYYHMSNSGMKSPQRIVQQQIGGNNLNNSSLNSGSNSFVVMGQPSIDVKSINQIQSQGNLINIGGQRSPTVKSTIPSSSAKGVSLQRLNQKLAEFEIQKNTVETQIQKEKSKKKRKSVLQELTLQLDYITKQTFQIRAKMMEQVA